MLFFLQEHVADRQALYVVYLAGTYADRQTLYVVFLAGTLTFADKQTLYVVFLAGTFLCTFAERQTLCCFSCRNICRQANTACCMIGKHCMLFFLQKHLFDICRQANTLCCFSCRNISLHICRQANIVCCFSCRNICRQANTM